MLTNKKQYCESLIQHLESKDLAVSLLFVVRDKQSDAYQVYGGNLSKDVADTLRDLCLKISKKSYSHPETKDFAPYDSSQKQSTCTEFIEGDDLDALKPMLGIVETKPLDLKKIDKQFLDSLWFYAIKLDNGKEHAIFFKKYSEGMVLTKKTVRALIFQGGDFDQLKRDVFMMYERMDAIYFKKKLIIRSKGNFEKIFNFFEQIKKNARSAISFIKKQLPFKIDNIDALQQQWMQHEIKIRKLNNIYAKKTLEKIKPENINMLVREGILKAVVVNTNKDGEIVLQSDDPWEVLKILDDDYVISRLTEINYEAASKKQIGS